MKTWKIITLSIGVIAIMLSLDFGFGYLGVFKTKTVGKAQQNANREVYEETQSYVFGKRQEALKFYKEYNDANTEDKKFIEEMVSHSFAEFDENKLNDPLKTFVYNCKY